MQVTAKMQAVITQLLEQHGIDGNEVEAFLWLALPACTERLIIERINARYLSVALARPEGDGYFTLAPEVFFTTDTSGWRPVHLDGSEPVTDLVSFVEAWAERILAEGWLTQAEQLPEPPWQVDQVALWASGCDDGPACEAWEEDEPCDIPF